MTELQSIGLETLRVLVVTLRLFLLLHHRPLRPGQKPGFLEKHAGADAADPPVPRWIPWRDAQEHVEDHHRRCWFVCSRSKGRPLLQVYRPHTAETLHSQILRDDRDPCTDCFWLLLIELIVAKDRATVSFLILDCVACSPTTPTGAQTRFCCYAKNWKNYYQEKEF